MGNNDITLLSVQKIHKPNIEEVIPELLNGDMQKSALRFVAYLRENKMKPAWTLHNAWKAVYKGKPFYYIRLGWGFGKERVNNNINEKWEVTPYLNHITEYEETIINEGWQNIIWDNLRRCKACVYGCSPGIDKIILGKELKGLCGGFLGGRFPVMVENPDEARINIIKKLLELEKNTRKEKR